MELDSNCYDLFECQTHGTHLSSNEQEILIRNKNIKRTPKIRVTEKSNVNI